MEVRAVDRRVRDVLIKLDGRARSQDIHSAALDEIVGARRPIRRGDAAKLLHETLMRLKSGAETDGDAQLVKTINTVIKDNEFLEQMKQRILEYQKTAPKQTEEEIKNAQWEYREERYQIFLDNCNRNSYLNGIKDKVTIDADLSWKDFIESLNRAGIKVYVKGENLMALPVIKGLHASELSMWTHYFEYPDEIHIRTIHNRTAKSIIRFIAQKLGNAPLLFYTNKLEPEEIIAEMFLGHSREDLCVSLSAVLSNSIMQFISLENSDIKPSEFLLNDLG